jgi:hypothetical protein
VKRENSVAARRDIKRALADFYSQNGIAVAHFACPHRARCDADAADAGRPLTHGIEAHVGHKYGQATRVAVVSLDSGGDSSPLAKRTRGIEGVTPDNANTHMRGTYRFLEAMLRQEIGVQSPMPYYAMLNSAKCSADDGKADSVPLSLHHRCHEYVLGELRILDPEIIWLQGRMVQDVFARLLTDVRSLDHRIDAWLVAEGIHGPRVGDWIKGVARQYVRSFSHTTNTCLAVITVHPSDRYGKWALFERTMMTMIGAIVVA